MKKQIVKLMVVAVCFGLCACSGGIDGSGTKDVAEESTSESRTIETGDTIKNDIWEVSLWSSNITYGTGMPSLNGGELTNIQCELEFVVKNLDNETQSLRDAVNNVVVKCGGKSYGECSYFYGVGETESSESSVTDTASIEPSDTRHMYAQLSVSEENLVGEGVIELTVAGQKCKIEIES
ncbi:MAG TPA: hypothetical protein IAB13_04965 [Candidatus Avanaerovorax faecigallinarum]|nr:hypothetical protein [Candidatus Avanaerovorax faecigallinarum]